MKAAVRNRRTAPSAAIDFKHLEQQARDVFNGEDLDYTLRTIEEPGKLQESADELTKKTKEGARKTDQLALFMILGCVAGIAYSFFQLFDA